jgi:hypothetical protein
MEREGLHCCMWWCSDVNAACLSAVIKPVGEKLSVCLHAVLFARILCNFRDRVSRFS